MNERFAESDALFKHELFIKYMWAKRDEPFIVGTHTASICNKIDEAIDNYKQNKSTFLIIKVPFRHGKSDIVSRYLPLRFMTMFPDSEVMLTTYAASLAVKFSRFGRNLTRTPRYKKLVKGLKPERKISGASAANDHWSFAGAIGSVSASGLVSGLTGNGYHLGILDDFCAGRAEAESVVMREKTWDAFRNDFMTRRAPVSITIILATPWHEDDVIGRIEKSMKTEEDFPKFEVIRFPAWDDKYLELDRAVRSKYLFPERYSDDWYKTQASTLGAYGTASLLLCDPQPKKGNILDIDKVQYVDSVRDFPKVKFIRSWDLAHSEKQRMKDDPDYTSGTLHAWTEEKGMIHLWVKDVSRIRASAPERDSFISQISEKDGYEVDFLVESSVDAKDAVELLRSILRGKRTINSIRPKGDKVVRASPMEAIFEAGNVHILRADWNYEWLAEIKSFPRGKHDDQIDNLSAGYEFAVNKGITFSEEIMSQMRAVRL